MPISMQRFESRGRFARLTTDDQERHETPARASPFYRQCHYCGFECTGLLRMPRTCPKCGGSAWEQYAKPRSLLETCGNVERDPNGATVTAPRAKRRSRLRQGVVS